MMMRDKIPLNWVDIVSALVIMFFAVACLSWDEFRTESLFHTLLAVILIVAMLWAPWGLTERRELDAKGIHRRDISQLFLVVIPKGIEPFAPTMESGYDYLGRNRRHIIAEQIKYAPMFEKYYGLMDFDVRNYSRC